MQEHRKLDIEVLRNDSYCTLARQIHRVSGENLPVETIIFFLKTMDCKDPMEALLCSQALAVHSEAMKLLKFGSHAQNSFDEKHCGLSVKLMNLYIKQMDTLRKYRKGGIQKIQVERIRYDVEE